MRTSAVAGAAAALVLVGPLGLRGAAVAVDLALAVHVVGLLVACGRQVPVLWSGLAWSGGAVATAIGAMSIALAMAGTDGATPLGWAAGAVGGTLAYVAVLLYTLEVTGAELRRGAAVALGGRRPPEAAVPAAGGPIAEATTDAPELAPDPLTPAEPGPPRPEAPAGAPDQEVEVAWRPTAEGGVFVVHALDGETPDGLPTSEPISWRWHLPPVPTSEARAAHAAFVQQLVGDGWERAPGADGAEWYALRLRRPAPAAAPRESYRGRAMKGGALSIVGYGTTQALNFAAYAWLARLVSPEEFGTFAAGALISGVAALFAESGMLAALITQRDRFEEAANTAVIWNVVSGIGLVLLSAAASPLVGLAFDSSEVTAVSVALSGILLLRAVGIVPDALLQRRFSFVRRLVIEPLGVLAFATVAIVMTSDGAGVWGLVAGTYAAMLLRTVSAWAFARWRPHPRLATMAMWRELVGYARPVVLGEMVRRIVGQLDVLLIGRFVGLGPLGQYRYATRLASLPHATWVSVGAYVLLPVFARLAEDPPRLRAACLRAAGIMALGVYPASLLLVALGLPAAVIVFGPEWREAGWAVMALAGYPLGHALVSVASETFKATRNPGELPKMHAVAGMASVTCSILLLPLGMLGVAAGVSVAAIIVKAYAIRRLHVVAGVPAGRMIGQLVPPLACSLAMGAFGFALNTFVVQAEERPGLVAAALLVGQALLLLGLYLAALLTISRNARGLARAAIGMVRGRLGGRKAAVA